MARSKATGTRKAKRAQRARRIVQHAARLAAGELARAKGERDVDPEDDGEERSVENAPAPPPMPGEAPSPVPEWVDGLGPVPEDPLAAQYWLYRANVMSAHGALKDNTISEATRRKELRTISASASRLMPDARRWEAEQIVKKHRAELEAKATAKTGAKLVDLDDATTPAKPATDDDFGGPDEST